MIDRATKTHKEGGKLGEDVLDSGDAVNAADAGKAAEERVAKERANGVVARGGRG